jgi:O-antigen/teichoic acid export membrane protein
VLIGACGILGTLLIALHQSRVLVGQVLLALAVNLAANAALIPTFGAVGAGLATVVTEAVSLALLAVACERVAPGVLLARRGTYVATPAIPPAVTA